MTLFSLSSASKMLFTFVAGSFPLREINSLQLETTEFCVQTSLALTLKILSRGLLGFGPGRTLAHADRPVKISRIWGNEIDVWG